MIYILDTNICIYIIKKQPTKVIEHFKSLPVGDIGMSSVTFAELMYGVEKSQQQQKNKAALEQFTLPLEILAFDENAASNYGRIRAFLEKNGTPIGPLDLMIAAHAQSLNAVLVTNNTREFERIPELKLEDWAHK